MISARIDAPAPAPVQPQRPGQVGSGREGRPAPAFDDALRGQEAVSASDADAPDSDAAPAPVIIAAPLPVAQPIALDTLIAQVLPQALPHPQERPHAQPPTTTGAQPLPELTPQNAQPQGTARESRRTPAAVADRQALKAAAASAFDLSTAPDPDVTEIAEPTDTPAQRPTQGHGATTQGTPRAGATPFAPVAGEKPDRNADASRMDQDDKAAPATRNVAVGKVTTATHFPVTADPVRQIATEVMHAIDSKSGVAAPDTRNAPLKTVSIQLEPESLGAVTLRMRLSGDQLSVRVEVAEPATLDLIQRERDRLQKSMATDTVSIHSLEIRAAGDLTPMTSGDNANAPKQDPNAPGQQLGHNATSQGGEPRRNSRGDSQPRSTQKNGQANDSTRSDISRGVYL